MIKFRESQFSALSNAIKGAGIGATLGVGLNKIGNAILPTIQKTARTVEKVGKGGEKYISPVFNDKGEQIVDKFVTKSSGESLGEKLMLAKDKVNSGLDFIKLDSLKGVNNKFWNNLNKLGKWILDNPSKAAFSGALIGASLAIGYYLIKKSYSKVSNVRSSYNGSGILGDVVDDLEKTGFKNGIDFTTDPVKADYLKTKVCLIVSSSRDEANLVINSISDPKLDSESNRIIKNLPSNTRFYKKESDKNNELTLSTIPSNMDHSYISSIAERFIRRKYPVFLIEIN